MLDGMMGKAKAKKSAPKPAGFPACKECGDLCIQKDGLCLKCKEAAKDKADAAYRKRSVKVRERWDAKTSSLVISCSACRSAPGASAATSAGPRRARQLRQSVWRPSFGGRQFSLTSPARS